MEDGGGYLWGTGGAMQKQRTMGTQESPDGMSATGGSAPRRPSSPPCQRRRGAAGLLVAVRVAVLLLRQPVRLVLRLRRPHRPCGAAPRRCALATPTHHTAPQTPTSQTTAQSLLRECTRPESTRLSAPQPPSQTRARARPSPGGTPQGGRLPVRRRG